MPDNENTRTSNGYQNTTDIAVQITNAIRQSLDNNFSSFTRELRELRTALERQSGSTSGTTSAARRQQQSLDSLYRSIPRLSNAIDSLENSIDDANRQARRNSREWRRQERNASFRNAGADVLGSSQLRQRSEQYEKDVRAVRDSATEQRRTLERIEQQNLEAQNQNIQRSKDQLKQIRDAASEARSRGDTEQFHELLNQARQLSQYMDALREQYRNSEEDSRERLASFDESIRSQLSDLGSAYERESAQIVRSFEQINEYMEDSRLASESLQRLAPSFSQFMERNVYTTDNERFNDAVDELRETLETANRAIEERIRQLGDTNDAERANLEQQLRLNQAQLRYIQGLNPVTSIWRDVGNKMKDVAKNLATGTIKNVVKYLEDRYMNSYIEGFQRVYDSIENTRNTISARLKMDSGAYKEYQEQIYSEIESRNLQGVISQTDVDEMIVSLNAAGITDQQLLQELAIEGAYLKATGSSIDLGNEETLQQLQRMYQASLKDTGSSEKAFNEITSMLDKVAGTEQLIRDTYGSDAALVNNAISQYINASAKMGLASGKSAEQIGKDIQSSIYTAQGLYNIGLDPSTLQQSIQSVWDNAVADNDTFGKILITSGMTRENLMNMDMGEAMQFVADKLGDILSDVPVNYITEFAQAYGITDEVKDANELLSYIQAEGVKTKLSEEDQEAVARNVQESRTDVSKYYSATYTGRKERENELAQLAIDTEQMYEGDKLVVSELQTISSSVESIIDILGESLVDTGTSIIRGGASSAFGGAAGAGGAAAGAGSLLAAGGVAVAGAAATALAYKYIGKPWQEKIESSPWFDTDEEKTATAIGKFADTINMLADSELTDADARAEAAEQMLNAFNSMSTEAKKTELLKRNLIDDEKKNSLTDEDIQKMFEENIVAEQKNIIAQANNLAQQANFKQKYATQLAGIEQDIASGSELSRSEFEGRLGGKSAVVELMSSVSGADIIDESGQMIHKSFEDMTDIELQAYAAQLGIDNISTDDKEKAIQTLTQKNIENLNLGSDITSKMTETVRELESRKEVWEGYNATLQDKWNKLLSKEGNENLKDADFDTVRQRYWLEYLSDGGTYNYIRQNANGDPILYDDNGYYGIKYTEGKQFESGLTEVPYDMYPALLHAGERVLTAEEAEAYNELSSYAVSNFANTTYGSQVFKTNQYGESSIGEIKSSINSQTTSIEAMLREILKAINSLTTTLATAPKCQSKAAQNAIRYNSNITQLNTLM